MRLLRLIALVTLTALPAAAQEENEADKTYLEGWIEDALSGAGRSVTITGFRGALSSNATLEKMTISDDDGIWLTMEDATLVWSRSALLRGEVDVTELSAAVIDIARLPEAGEQVTPDDAEATAFALPELPVSVSIDELRADEVRLGAPILGEPATMTVEATVQLADGAGEAQLAIERTDRPDQITLDAAFDNESRVLAIDLDFDEAEGGMVSKALNIPGEPAMRLQVQGEAPLSDFQAQVALSSDGTRRFGGAISIAALDAENEEAGYAFSTDLSGDLRQLFTPDLHPFFGENAALRVSGQTYADGRLTLDTLALDAGGIELSGDLALDADGWPREFNLDGRVGGEGRLRLPISEPITTIESGRLTASYNAAEGDAWTADITVDGLTRDGLEIDGARVEGIGTITRGDNESFLADLTFSTQGVTHRDEALARAIGGAPNGKLRLTYQPERPTQIETLEVASGDATLTAQGTLDGLAEGFPVSGRATLQADDLRRFAGVARRDLAGSANLTVLGEGNLLGGAFDVEIEAATQDLETGTDRLDPLLTGRSTLEIDARRTEEGTFIDRLVIDNASVDATAEARLNAESGALTLQGRLQDLTLVEPRLAGPATIDTNLGWQADGQVTVNRLLFEAVDTTLTAEGTLNAQARTLPFNGRLNLQAADLSRLAALANRPLDGAIDLDITGTGTIRKSEETDEPETLPDGIDSIIVQIENLLGDSFEIDLAATSQNLQTGIERLDPILRGNARVEIETSRTEEGTAIDRLMIDSDALTAEAEAQLTSETATLALEARLDDLGRVEPTLSGPADIDTALTWRADDGQVTISRLSLDALDASLKTEGTIGTGDPDLPVSGQLSLDAADLSRLAGLAGRPLAGTIDLDVAGTGKINGRSADAEISLDATGFRSGIAQIDRILGSDITLDTKLAYGDSTPFVETLELTAARLSASASSAAPGEPITITANLADLGLLAPGINGLATLNGRVTILDSRGEDLDVNLDFDGPGGVGARITGRINDLGQTVSLAINGTAPLALANSFIQPRSIQGPARFDLRIDGKPGLSALSGQASISNARLAIPGVATAIEGLTGTVNLSGGQANADITGNTGTGGNFRITGPITLSAPSNASLEARINRLRVIDPSLFETIVDGRVTITGPLTGGARIGGAINLGRTEVQVPSGGSSAPGTIPDLRHVNEPAAVRRTRQRAGLIETGKSGGPAAAFPIDLVINAPNQIFVRGRGLDAELGGSIRLGGTTADVNASGTFELIRGRMDILTKRLDLTEGLIDLRGALDPYLRFVARTETDELTIDIILEGLASDPNITFTSSPDLPQEEILAQLLFGRSFTSMSAFQAAQLVSAVATLSGRGSGGLTGRLRGALGLSDFDVTTSETGATQFSAGAYLSENIYSEFTADSEGNNEINLNLDLSSSVTVKGSASSDGDTGLGIFYEKDY
ncbi:MAG: translocation/assembly module TamB domain-containing protein [Roseovarius sp.]|uniref:translocation/assembly module TamB domain-containing protein n=1 Tax=Roseovarius sp. TaxID=1486281 RepID=UPI0032EE1D78